MDRRPDRWETFTQLKQLDFLNYKRFSEIDGEKLISTHQLQQIFENNDYNMRKGMVGCFMSHIVLCTQLINSQDDTYLILEDDVEPQTIDAKLMISSVNVSLNDFGDYG